MGINGTYDRWNASSMLCQLSYAVRSVRVRGISELSFVDVSTLVLQCVVIGLQSTGEARTLEQLGENGELTEFVSTAKYV